MLKKIYSSTLKQIIRSPVTWICFILMFIYGFFLHGYNGYNYHTDYVRTVDAFISGCIYSTALISYIIFSISITYDHSNSFYDIEAVTKMKCGTFLLSKALAYTTAFIICSFILLLDNYFSSFLFHINSDIKFPFKRTAIRMLINYFYIGIPSIFLFIGTIMAITIITKKKSICIITGVIYLVIFASIKYFYDYRYLSSIFYFPPTWIGKFLDQGANKYFPPTGDALAQIVVYIAIGLISYGLSYITLSRRES